MEFVSKIVGSVAWPTVGGIAAWRLKTPVKALLEGRRLSEIKAGPGGVELKTTAFDEGLDRATADVTASLTAGAAAATTTLEADDHEPNGRVTPTADPDRAGDAQSELAADQAKKYDEVLARGAVHSEQDRLFEVAAVSPTGAVIASFQRIEIAISELALWLGYADVTMVPVAANLRRLQLSGAVDDATIEAIEQLQSLRNLAAHGDSDDVDVLKAHEFVRLSSTVLTALQSRSGRAYEIAVRAALQRVVGSAAKVLQSVDSVVDLVLRSRDERAVGVQVKYRQGATRLSSTWLRSLPRWLHGPTVLVCNIRLTSLALSEVPSTMRAVVWVSPADDEDLREAVEVQVSAAQQADDKTDMSVTFEPPGDEGS
jgi:hypothetical protein